MKHLLSALALTLSTLPTMAIDLTQSTIVYNPKDAPLVKQMATVLADDIARVSGVRPIVSERKGKGHNILLATHQTTKRAKAIKGAWERYAIATDENTMTITGSDARGLAYGVLHISEMIGVSPWYWFADVAVNHSDTLDLTVNYVSPSPTIKFRGIFINDEDWGMKTWAAGTFEKELGDIGPNTYDKVCELILRLHGNMLAPAMHSCTGAFYSHPESQQMAGKWGIMITTSHCEPMLFNNAAHTEWVKARDGEWNYETNREKILEKFDNRLHETSQYDNIYTTGMRGLHDEAMKGSRDNHTRARTLEKVFAEQRRILERHKGKAAKDIPQIFVPYKETLDIYDAGLRVPDDITLVWPDDNYGYMKRVSNDGERRRSGHSGVYYHLSYLGTPHDNLWLPSTSPMLMYEELKKAYDAGADRYWLLNVGDIKPMEIEMTHFMDMAYRFHDFSYDNVNDYQAGWLADIYGQRHKEAFQYILDTYYRLAWDRKPEFMGYEMEWDSKENKRLHDTDFSFADGSAQRRLHDYEELCSTYRIIERDIAPALRPALFEMLGYAVLSASQMNRKFLYAQRNHETGSQLYTQLSRCAYDSLEVLREQYNSLLGGKWRHMMSAIPPGLTAKYHLLPDFSDKPTDAYKLPAEQRHPVFASKVDLATLTLPSTFRLLKGIGTDWVALQLGDPMADKAGLKTAAVDIPLTDLDPMADSVRVCVCVVPMWPVAYDKGNSIVVSVDDAQPVTCTNKFKEWSLAWKIQVLANRKEHVLTFPLDKHRQHHHLTLAVGDPGQIVQQITYETVRK